MKATDTGLVMNYHALAPRKYKQSVVAGFVHRIHRACSTWENFHTSLQKAKCILEQNQKALDKVLGARSTNAISIGNTTKVEAELPANNEPIQKRLIFIEYRGKVTDDYCRALNKIEAPC